LKDERERNEDWKEGTQTRRRKKKRGRRKMSKKASKTPVMFGLYLPPYSGKN
jgi:hypothetical protein